MNIKSNFLKTPLFISAIFCCIFASIFFFLYRAINNNNRESESNEQKWRNEEVRRDGIKTLEHSITTIEKERVELETHFAQSSDIVPFLDTIEGLAPKANVKAEVTSVDVLKDNNGLLVGMEASGNFNGLYKFLTLLENSPYELEFIGVGMRRQTEAELAGEGKNVNWNANFKIKLLSFTH